MSETAEATPVTYRTGQALLAEFEQTGSERAFEQIVRLYAGMVFSVCQQVTKNAHDAEDSAQATFLALATQVKLGKHVKCLGPWLRQVAKRTALDLCKSRKRREKREADHGQFSATDRFNGNAGEANLESQDYKTALHDEINKLPTRYRLPLVMHYFGGIPPEQTAIELNCKPKTLAVRMHRGRKMLAAQLSRRGIFVGGEMLGIASAPMMYQMMGGQLAHTTVHATAHAAVGLTGGLDITSMISTRVMALVNGSAKAAMFAKIKFLIVALVLFSSVLTGAAQTIRTAKMLPANWSHIRFNLIDWIKPVLRSVMPQGKIVAQATTNSANLSADSNINLASANYAILSDRSSFGRSNVVLASLDSNSASEAGSDYVLISNATLSKVKLPNNGSIQFHRSLTSPASIAGNTPVDGSLAGTTTINGAGEQSMTFGVQSVPSSPTPEPIGTAAVLLAGSFLLRRPTIKHAK